MIREPVSDINICQNGLAPLCLQLDFPFQYLTSIFDKTFERCPKIIANIFIVFDKIAIPPPPMLAVGFSFSIFDFNISC